MKYKGRHIDPVSFWNRYVEFPTNIGSKDGFLPKAVCPNPNHDTLKKHFQINGNEPYVHCFAACGISGSWEHAICVIEGIYEKFKVDLAACGKAWEKKPAQRSQGERDQLRRYQRAHREASKIILRAAGGKLEKFSGSSIAKKKNSPKPAKAVPPADLRYESYLPQIALEYLENRKVSSSSISAWKIGWLPEEQRIVIPGKDENGITRFLIKRAVLPSQNPKYLYWPEKDRTGWGKSDVLFGACQIDLDMIKSHGLVLVEGSIDVVVFHQHGLKNTVGILGTGISEKQRRIIARINPPKIYDFFDKDLAGVHNIEIAAGMLRKYPQYVCRFPKSKADPAELTREEAYRSIDRSIPIFRFVQDNSLNVRTHKKRKDYSLG